MDATTAARWKNEALDTIFAALAASTTLTARFIYKGARILNRLLNDATRQSLDIDANITREFIEQYPGRRNQCNEIQSEISIALIQFFSWQDEVVYSLERITVLPNPKQEHPMGWNSFTVRINLRDHRLPGILGLPVITIDIAAPELFGSHAVAPLEVGGHEVNAYTLERIAGEKLRAFLSTLPAYRNKIRKPGEAVRVKDLYDVARIVAAKPVTDRIFWMAAGNEFQQACRSRYIDCKGIESFREALEVTRATYENESTIPGNIPFQTAWNALEDVVGYWETEGLIPILFELPEDAFG